MTLLPMTKKKKKRDREGKGKGDKSRAKALLTLNATVSDHPDPCLTVNMGSYQLERPF